MDDDQKELAKIAAESAFRPFANLIEKLFGGAAEQVGGMWTDGLRRRFRRIKIFEKLTRKIEGRVRAEYHSRQALASRTPRSVVRGR